MSEALRCNRCNRVDDVEDTGGWLQVSRVGPPGDPADARLNAASVLHVCSWSCLVELSVHKRDLWERRR